MIKNYFKTTFRYFWNHKTFSLINIIGLATGICVCFFALLYVQFELSRDGYNRQADNIYRLVTDIKTSKGINYESTPAPMAPAIQSEFPEIKAVARVFMDDMIIQSKPDNAIKEEIAYADASVFKIFTWPVLRGNKAHLFDAPFNVVLSESAAKKYFGTDDALGQTLLINGKDRATVTGIMKDIPYDSHLRVDMLFSISTLVNANWDHNWTYFGFYTYLLLQPGYNAAELQAKLPAFVKANFDQSQVKYQLAIEPLKKVYLYGKPRGHRTGASASGSITNVYIVSVIAILVLFIACFNFINLTTAFSLQRAKEIGVRKVLGASKSQLVFQFFMDAIMLCLISFVIALALAVLLLPLFNQLVGTIISTNIFSQFQNIAWLFLIAVIVGILSGAYPALFLSGFKPISSLKGKFASSGKGLILRKTLVVAQFSISIFLIIATVVVYQQLDFMQNQQLGFQKDHKLVIDFQFDSRVMGHTDAIKQQLAAIPGVGMASFSSSIPGTPNNQYKTVLENSNNEKQEQRTDAYFIDNDFLKQYQVNVIAGRGFSKNSAADTLKTMLINETMVKNLGFTNPDEAIGKHFFQMNHEGVIIGVVKDFHFHSFQEKVQPLTLTLNPWNFTLLTVNVSSENTQRTINKIESAWKNIAPGLPFVYYFADEAYNQQYVAQKRFGSLFICFAMIAIVISCLGLLGLSAFNTTQRKKEIGIRKVLGASVGSITAMLSKDFVRLILIALLVASPISWWAMHSWLQGFAYRINIPLWVFLFSGAAAIFIALLTISFQSIKAAVANPVKSLRND
ncbi:ABC transporter permease [Mucilaginibacter sp. McL0603]|uniref:ABC transporter permease n=1 Tax=Mucilaginibacter sp. McL0603 TaxID=3415670 RepID=UPI003CF071E8